MKTKIVEFLSKLTTTGREICDGIYLMDFTIVNACFIGKPNSKYILVDSGLENSFDFIKKIIDKHFKGQIPKAVILTHGHFDHVGSIKKIITEWNIPIYAHNLEIPYLTGEKDYPEGDPTVDSGMVAQMSTEFPHTSIDISNSLHALSEDGTIPEMPEWKWIHTPGHTPGHISLYKKGDGVIIAGDAITTTKQESLLSVITKKEEIGGPPKYYTQDFEKSYDSIKKLSNLIPSLVIPSHGKEMKGEKLTEHLNYLINNFHTIAFPNNKQFDYLNNEKRD